METKKRIKEVGKTAKQLERHFKGVANHHRINILFLVKKRDGIAVGEIAETLGTNLKTTSEHIRRLVQAGLVNKKYSGSNVVHTVSPYGRIFLTFIKTFSNS